MKYLNLRSKWTVVWLVLLAVSVAFYLSDGYSLLFGSTQIVSIEGFEPTVGSETHNFFDLLINLINLLISGVLAIAAIKKR